MQGMLEWTSTLTQLASEKTGFPNLYGFGGLQVASNCFKKGPFLLTDFCRNDYLKRILSLRNFF